MKATIKQTTYKVNVQATVPYGGQAVWGTINGTLTDQTDLQTALDTKAASSTVNNHLSNYNNPHAVTAKQVGAYSQAIVTKTTDYTATLDDQVIVCDASSGAVTITLPTAASALSSGRGHVYCIFKKDSTSNDVIIDANGSETIDGELTFNLVAQYESIKVISDGTEWLIIEA